MRMVAAGVGGKKRTIGREAIGLIKPGTEVVLVIVTTIPLRQEAVLDAIDLMRAGKHVAVRRIKIIGEAVDVMMPAGF